MRQEGPWPKAEPDVASGGATALDRDRITLTGITGYGHHGVFGFEREQGQPFVVDLTCQLDLSAAAASDDLQQTIDYGSLAQRGRRRRGAGPT